VEGRLYVCDSTDDRVLCLTDRDGSGSADAAVAGEAGVFYDDSSPGPDLSVPAHMVIGFGGRVCVLDGGTLDTLLCLEDLNGDGDANDPGEAVVAYDASGGGPQLYTPNTIVEEPGGSLVIADDGSEGKRLVRLRDLNADGDALDLQEATVVYDLSALSVPALEDIEALAARSDGSLIVSDKTHQALFVLTDLTSDGDFLDDGEVRTFYQSAGALTLADPDAVVIAGERVYAVDEDNGLIICCEDRNADGDALDPEEAWAFLDGTAAVVIGDINDLLALPVGAFLALDAARDTAVLLEDLDGDGDALDEGEVRAWLLHDGSLLGTPSGLVLVREEGPTPSTFIRGDTTGEATVNLSDPVRTLNYLFLGAESPPCLDAADADDDGDINISDPVYVLNHLFLGGPAPPPPYPAPGPDLTPDTIDCKPGDG
jgi:hypothetical protein